MSCVFFVCLFLCFLKMNNSVTFKINCINMFLRENEGGTGRPSKPSLVIILLFPNLHSDLN